MTPDFHAQCEGCPYLKFEGELQVGSLESGGPEPFYSCEKNRKELYGNPLSRASERTCPISI